MGRMSLPIETPMGVAAGELTLKNRHLELTIRPDLGCHWSQLKVSAKGQWHELLVPAEPTSKGGLRYGSFVMAPWSNRIERARFQFAGESYRLRANRDDSTAIHGDVRSRPWEVENFDGQTFVATLDSAGFEDFNFPFSVSFRYELELARECIRTRFTMENRDERAIPLGCGFHPFFRRRLSSRDRDVIVVLPARRVYPLRNCLPTGAAVEVSDQRDLSSLAPLGNRDLDDCFTDFETGTFRLFYPGTGLEVRLDVDPAFGHAVVYAPPHSTTGSGFVAVEPVSHVTNGVNLLASGWKDTGVAVIDPGATWSGSWALSVGDI